MTGLAAHFRRTCSPSRVRHPAQDSRREVVAARTRIAEAGDPVDEVSLPIRRLPHASGLPLPEHASPGSAGLDLRAAVAEDVVLDPGERTLVPTGLVLELPRGWEGQVRPRSGLAVRYGISLLNSPGTIDSDYRGEVMVVLANLGGESFTIRRGDRIAQLVVSPVSRVVVQEASELGSTDRGEGGFGSTGVD